MGFYEPIKGIFLLVKDGRVVEKYNAKNVKDAYDYLSNKIPGGYGVSMKRDDRATGEIMIGSHVFEIKPLYL